MNDIFKKWLIPFCLLIIILTQLLTYYLKNEINPGLWAVVVALIPSALKGLEVNLSKYLEWLLRIITILLLIFSIFYIIW